MNRGRTSEIFRFVLAGGSTTILSYAIYLALLYLGLSYVVAYPIAFVAGIFWSYFANSLFVFNCRPTLRGLATFPAVYIAQLVVGTGAVHAAVSLFGMPAWSGPLLALIATVPVTYVLSRWVIKKTSADKVASRRT